MSKLFQISEEDLALLERSAAVLHECASMSPTYMTPEVQVAAEETKRALSDIRWGNGPYQAVERVAT